MNGLIVILIFFGSMAVMAGIFFLLNWLIPKDMEFPTQHTSTMEKTKCTNCGHEGNVQDDIDEQNYFWEEALWGYSEDEKGEVFDKAC